MRRLIVNADDFGHSAEVNDGVIEAHERGIVTSASLMVRRAAAREAAAYGRRLSLGLHVDLGEWICVDGVWRSRGETPEPDIRREVRAQLAAFRDLAGRDPTHLDSHQHVHRSGAARQAGLELAAELRIPLRELTGEVRYVGGFYGQSDAGEPWPEGITVEHLVGLITSLEPGVTELSCHPARGVPPSTTYAREREVELAALCDPLVREALSTAGVALISFRDLHLRRGSLDGRASEAPHLS